MNGAESLVRTLLAGGVEVCFTNPGTSEMHFVSALDRVNGMRCVLGLFEGVVSGAADGYARMAGKPASTLLHLGPGLANATANLHNASRSQAPIVNIVGDHATYHRRHDAPLNADIEAIARPYSKWLRTSVTAADCGADAAEAIISARSAPGQIATLILPADAAWSEGGRVAAIPVLQPPPVPAASTIEEAAKLLRSGEPTGILMTGNALFGEGLRSAGRIAAATGARLIAPYGMPRSARGAGLPPVGRVPYALDQAIAFLSGLRQLILVGAPPPVAFFAYPGKPGTEAPQGCTLFTLARCGEDYVAALAALADAVSAKRLEPLAQESARPAWADGPVDLSGLAAVVGALLPENAIVVDESLTSGRNMLAMTKGSAPHDWLVNPGGSIGLGMPLAVGTAVACPDRPVLCLSGDGSGMYTLQALWTMARESLRVTTVIFANRSYAILKQELSNVGGAPPGHRALDMLELGRPDLDWVSLAKGMGVPGRCVTTLEGFAGALRDGFQSAGPNLIEVML